MKILICIKRVPDTGAKIVLTPDQQAIDTKYLGFTMSPHEECAVEEAVRLKEAYGGEATVLTLGPAEAVEQLRAALSVGVDHAVLLQTDGRDWDPQATARAITAWVQAEQQASEPFDLLLFGNESADAGGYQVGVRVAHALGLPFISAVKQLQIGEGEAMVHRDVPGGQDVFVLPLPAAIAVKEGINLPRYPSLPGRLRAKKKPISEQQAPYEPGGLRMVRLETPPEQASKVQILGHGPEAAPQVVDILQEMGVLVP